MNIEFDSYKQKLHDIRPALEGLADSLNLEGLKNELERLHAMQEAPGFWDDPVKSQKIVMKIKQAEGKIERYNKMDSTWEDLITICEMAAEEDDDSMLPELKEGFEFLTHEMESCRLETLLTGKYDKNNALMSFQAGAGGTEAQDWCQMLYRMYTRWAERSGFTYKIMDYQEGDEAGLKSASIVIEGENAYGFLKGESGVHRLVRVSPFDSNARRQTSFVKESIAEIERMHKLGVNLIGELCPYIHGWHTYTDKDLWDILEAAEHYDMVVSTHGTTIEQDDALVAHFKKLKIVGAHPGEKWDLLPHHFKRMEQSENYYLDWSGYGLFRHGALRHSIDLFGKERNIFGSDYPTCNPAMYLGGVALDFLLTEDEKEHVLYKNAAKLLKIED